MMDKIRFEREAEWIVREKYAGRRTAAAEKDINRLRHGEHVSYVIGWAPFLGCRVDLSAHPLIPRPETEYWTERAIGLIKSTADSRPRVLDLFCGSGCIGLGVLKHVRAAQVDFADIESAYFAGIRKSLRTNRIDPRRARFGRANVFDGLATKRYDFILANPPYIPAKGRAVAASVLEAEPRQALFGGPDGLRYIKKILREARDHLVPNGMMMVEFDPPQKGAIDAYARERGWQTEFGKDQYGRWRWVMLVAKNTVPATGMKIKKRPTKRRP